MENNCTFLVSAPEKVPLPTVAEITAELESTDVQRKISALKKTIMLVLSGEEMPRVLMTVIRFCITVEDHALQKLLMFYYEAVRKYDLQGKLLPEMILVWCVPARSFTHRRSSVCTMAQRLPAQPCVARAATLTRDLISHTTHRALLPRSNALRNNLVHPNEYIRGSTLRFLCKLREPELVEPLISAIKQCLAHRHPYVRRNAVLTVYSIVKQYPDLYPDALDNITKMLEEETDPGTRRNAFIMLFSAAQEKATSYLTRNLEKVQTFGDGFALILLELIRKVARTDPSRKGPFIRIVFGLLDSPSAAVSYEAAGTLASLSASPAAVKAAASAYIKILNKESDNNVKLIILERLAAMKKRYTRVLREVVMDILRCLGTPVLDVRRRTLEVAMDLVSPRNVDEVMATLKKEIVGTGGKAAGGSAAVALDPEASAYRAFLITAIHGCAVRFPEVAPTVVHLLMDFLHGEGALSVIEFVREIVETFPAMRPAVLSKLRNVMPDVSSSEVYRVALWILGQYSISDSDVHETLHTVRECIGSLPLVQPFLDYAAAQAARAAGVAADAAISALADKEAGGGTSAKGSRPVVLADGTYATQSGLTETRAKEGSTVGATGLPSGLDVDDVRVPTLRRLLLAGDFFLGSLLSSTLVKLALRVCELHGRDSRKAKEVTVDAMLVMCALMELGASGLAGTPVLLPAALMPSVSARSYGGPLRGGAGGRGEDKAGASSAGVRIDQDSFERVVLCMRVLGDPAAQAATLPVLLHRCRDVFRHLLQDRRARAAQAVRDGVAPGPVFGLGSLLGPGAGGAGAGASEEKKSDGPLSQPDEMVQFRQLRGSKGGPAPQDDYDLALDDVAELSRAAGTASEDFMARLKRVHQLTGFADALYAEAVVRVAEFDILLDMTLINRTDTTMTNVTVELSVMGDLKLVERPAVFTLGPRDSRTVKASIKVASTETGHIFGNAVYSPGAGAAEPVVINLAEIHVDIMDYIQPVPISDAAFRSMWSDFEWENKVVVNTNIT